MDLWKIFKRKCGAHKHGWYVVTLVYCPHFSYPFLHHQMDFSSLVFSQCSYASSWWRGCKFSFLGVRSAPVDISDRFWDSFSSSDMEFDTCTCAIEFSMAFTLSHPQLQGLLLPSQKNKCTLNNPVSLSLAKWALFPPPIHIKLHLSLSL